MTNKGQAYNGALISELGVKRYLKANKSVSTSNVNFFIRGAEAEKAWKECNFGCHSPNYRSLKRQSSYSERLKPIEELSPMLAGIVDGVRHQTVGKVEAVSGGIKRTAEGLMLNGKKDFNNVGDENWAAYNFAKTTFEKVFTFEIDVLDNPIAQAVMTIVMEYISLLPEWVIEEAAKQNALKLPEKIDTVWLLKAASLGIIKNIDMQDLEQAAKAMNNPAQKLIGKKIGKRLSIAIGAAIATSITKSLMRNSRDLTMLKRNLVRTRKSTRTAKGGLAGTLMALLHSQGILNKAGESSRRLQHSCPTLWNTLRYQLNGANMIYFLVEPMIEEYVDRLALLEKNPPEFASIMSALIKARLTNKIFFPD